MHNTEHLHEQMRERRAYRGVQLAVYVIEHADDNGVYTAPSTAHLLRLLARPEDGKMTEAKAVDVAVVIRQLISQGVLEEESDGKRFILTGGGPMSGTRAVNVIESEAVAFMKNSAVHPDLRIMLASIVFADSEGTTYLRKGQLQAWLAHPGHRRASSGFVRSRIDGLIEAGSLAEGSTPTELRSMVAYGQEEDG